MTSYNLRKRTNPVSYGEEAASQLRLTDLAKVVRLPTGTTSVCFSAESVLAAKSVLDNPTSSPDKVSTSSSELSVMYPADYREHMHQQRSDCSPLVKDALNGIPHMCSSQPYALVCILECAKKQSAGSSYATQGLGQCVPSIFFAVMQSYSIHCTDSSLSQSDEAHKSSTVSPEW